jgi:hypothetical protein
MISPLTAYSNSSIELNAPTATQVVFLLQTVAYCGVFVGLWKMAVGYAVLSLFCAFGLGTFRFLVLD